MNLFGGHGTVGLRRPAGSGGVGDLPQPLEEGGDQTGGREGHGGCGFSAVSSEDVHQESHVGVVFGPIQ